MVVIMEFLLSITLPGMAVLAKTEGHTQRVFCDRFLTGAGTGRIFKGERTMTDAKLLRNLTVLGLGILGLAGPAATTGAGEEGATRVYENRLTPIAKPG